MQDKQNMLNSGLKSTHQTPSNKLQTTRKNTKFETGFFPDKTHAKKTKQDHGGVFTPSPPREACRFQTVQASKSPKEEPLVVEVVHWEDHICRRLEKHETF